MKRTARTTGIEPTVGAASIKLTFKDDAFLPRTVTLGTALARARRNSAGDVGQEGLTVAAPISVQVAISSPLNGHAKSRAIQHLTAEGTVEINLRAVCCHGDFDRVGQRLDVRIGMYRPGHANSSIGAGATVAIAVYICICW